MTDDETRDEERETLAERLGLEVGDYEWDHMQSHGIEEAFRVHLWYKYALHRDHAKLLDAVREREERISELEAEVERWEDESRLPPIYTCAECGALAPMSPVIDSGATLTCDECGERTVVYLVTVEEYREMHGYGEDDDGD